MAFGVTVDCVQIALNRIENVDGITLAVWPSGRTSNEFVPHEIGDLIQRQAAWTRRDAKVSPQIMEPDEKALWLDDIDEHASTAADEIIRWASAGMHMRRTATRDVEKGGHQIKKGDKVSVWFASGNRDEGIFNDPHAFEITRQPNPHLPFGLKGPHFCLGSHLSKLEIRVALVSLLKRFPGIEAK